MDFVESARSKLVFGASAQGTMEYLVIIAVVVVLSLVVVGLVITQVNSNSDVANTSSDIKQKVGVDGISLSSAVAGVDGNSLLVIKNISSDNFTLNKIVIDGVDHNFSSQIVAGDMKSFKLKSITSCVGAKKNYSIKVYYTSVNDLNKVADFQNITIDCTPVVTPASTAVEETIIPSNLIAHYLLNDSDSTTVVIDSSESEHTGTATTPTETMDVVGKINSAFTFSGNYVEVPASSDFDFGTGDFSIASWVWLQSDPSVWAESIFTYNNAGANIFIFTVYTGGDLVLFDGSFYNSGVVVPVEEWVHCVVVREEGVVKFYMNGVLINDNAGSNTTNFQNISTNAIGTDLWVEQFDGLLDDVRIYNKALSQTEVDFIYNSGAGTESE